MNSRRELMKLLGLAPAAPIAAAAALKEAFASPAIATALMATNVAQSAGLTIGGTGNSLASRVGAALAKKLGRLHSMARNECNIRRDVRRATGGFDFDIAALRSTSRAYKCSMQLRRNAEELQFLDESETSLWG